MAGREYYRIGCIRSKTGEVGYVTSFDESGGFSLSQNLKATVAFDSYDKVHYAKAFLEACNPEDFFDISRLLVIPSRVINRSVTAQRPADG